MSEITTDTIQDRIQRAMIIAVISLLEVMTDEQRLSVFDEFCKYCGSAKLPCYCTRDD